MWRETDWQTEEKRSRVKEWKIKGDRKNVL